MGNRKPLYGVGINDADYQVAIRVTVDKVTTTTFECPYYKRWSEMLKRCYSAKYHDKKPTYKGCRVCDEWKYFSNFKVWMEKQPWEGKQLDKDIVIKGNKVYSPTTCKFISSITNSFTTESLSIRGKYLIGVSFGCGKFRSRVSNPFTKKVEHLGSFSTELEAHLVWKKRKHELSFLVAELEEDTIVKEALTTRYL